MTDGNELSGNARQIFFIVIIIIIVIIIFLQKSRLSANELVDALYFYPRSIVASNLASSCSSRVNVLWDDELQQAEIRSFEYHYIWMNADQFCSGHIAEMFTKNDVYAFNVLIRLDGCHSGTASDSIGACFTPPKYARDLVVTIVDNDLKKNSGGQVLTTLAT